MSLDFSLYMDIDTGGKEPYRFYLYDGNATHNLIKMWTKAGVYECLYESHDKTAAEIVEKLGIGLDDMFCYPEKYKALEPTNKWGTYQNALDFLYDIHKKCVEHPKAKIYISAQ